MGIEITGMVDNVPERFVPAEMHGSLVEAEHMARYWWATCFCPGKAILDAGCGVGYGATMLHDAGASQVTAVDISEPVIEVATQMTPEGVLCERADLASLPYPNESFDVVVCFETIEHVDDRDAVLDELVRVMRSDGLLIISSPNRTRYIPGNPHHKHEYIASELYDALARRLAKVAMYRQHAMLASVITPTDSARFDGDTKRLVEPNNDDEIYTLAVAGSALPQHVPDIVALTQFMELRQWLVHEHDQRLLLERQADALRIASEQSDTRVEALRRFADAEGEIAILRERVTALGDELETARRALDSELAVSTELRQRLTHTDTMIHSMSASLSWRITMPLRSVKRLALKSKRR